MRAALRSPFAALALVVVAALALYAPLFGGYWLGDDFSNLYQLHEWLRQDRYWLEAARHFVTPGDPQSAFYRPLMMSSLFANLSVAGLDYTGWFAYNLMVHLANALLLALLVRRLAQACGLEAWMAAPLAVAWFLFDPVPVEGVYWISARADATVTLASLLALLAWSSPAAGARARWAPPLLVLLALGFKESAAVVPLQLALVALAWPAPMSRAQRHGCVLALGVMCAYLVARSLVFGNPWDVYHGPQRAGLVDAVASLPRWWQGLVGAAPGLAALHLGLTAVALGIAMLAARGTQARLVLALVCAGGGFALASLLNLGAMSVHGDGGRLAYAPLAWLALALGLALARTPATAMAARRAPTWLASIALAAAALAGAGVVHAQVRHVRGVQDSVRALVASLPPWAATHAGLTVLVVPERVGPVVALRNAQGAIALHPFQQSPLLHRVLPTLEGEADAREAQLRAGLATRLAELRPARLDQEVMAALLAPAAPRPADHVACWSGVRAAIVSGCAPDAGLACTAARCREPVPSP